MNNKLRSSPILPPVWTICDGRAGLEAQVVGLAEALGEPYERKTVHPRLPWTALPVRYWLWPFAALGAGSSRLAAPWPKLLIGCGWRSIPYMLAIKRLSKGATQTVQIQDPRIDPRNFDLVIAPEHDRLAGPNVFSMLGSPNRISQALLVAAADEWAPKFSHLPKPRIAVLIGGSSKAYRLTEARMREIAQELKALAGRGHGLMITTSRRTSAAAIAALRQELVGTNAVLWSGEGPNPYFGMLALSDAILVTADSTNMITEAAATGKPVHILPLLRGSAKFGRFHETLVARGVVRPFTGRIERWTYAPLQETARAAAFVKERLGLD